MHSNLIDLDNTLFLGIDIGTDTCKVILMKASQSATGEFQYQVKEAYKIDARGATNRSKVINVERTVAILSEVIEKVTASGCSGPVYVSFTIQDSSLKGKINRVSNPFSKHDRVIEDKDIRLALEMAGNSPLDSDREYLHLMPRNFYVNDVLVSSKPVGLSGSSLDVEVLLVSVLSESIKQIVYCVNEVEYPCNFLCATPFASAEAVLTEKEKIEGVLVIDFGAGNTSATVYEKNILKVIANVPLAGKDITHDIAQVLNISLDLAEFIKCKYGVVDREYIDANKPSISVEYNQNILEIQIEDIYKIVMARTMEILGLLKKQLEEQDITLSFPVVITGGSVRILGFRQLVEKIFDNKVRIAEPWNWDGPYTQYKDPSFSAAIGVCLAGLQHHLINGWSSFVDHGDTIQEANDLRLSVKKMYNRVSDKFRNFLSLGDIE